MSYQTSLPGFSSAALKLLLLAFPAVLGAFGQAAAHDAKPTAFMPQGWSYPLSCCSGYDCREVSSSRIGERSEGYVIKRTGEVLAYSDARLKDSPDGQYHWCSVAGSDDTRTVCLFVPPRSY